MPKSFIITLVIATFLILPGCSGKPVRHLNSDVCLMTPGTSKQEVLTYLGTPREQRVDQHGEIWIYYKVNKSLLRKTPFIGDKLGDEDVEVVTVHFMGDQINTCAYRSLTAEEFKQTKIGTQNEIIHQ